MRRQGSEFRRAGSIAIPLALVLTGCYHGSARTASRAELAREGGWVLVGDLHLVRQTADRDCGAAALAMMLEHWTIHVPPDEILRAAAVAPGHGITAGALRDFARQKGLQAYLVKGELTDLTNEVGLNRPVLVGLVQRYGDKALSHYEIVGGINPRTRRVLLFDPAHGLREDGFEGFSAEWDAAGRPTLVIVPS